MDQADRDCGGLFRRQMLDRGLRLGLVKRGQHLAAGVEPSVDFDHAIALDQRFGAIVQGVEAIDPGRILLADMEHVTEALGGDKAEPRALALQNQVGGERGGMDYALDFGRLRAGLRHGVAHRIHHAVHRIGRRGQGFGVDWLGFAVLKQNQIGEGAADIHAHEELSLCHLSQSLLKLEKIQVLNRPGDSVPLMCKGEGF